MVTIEKLGNYIERLDRPNTNLRYGIDDVCGITNTKQLVLGTKANLIGRTFEKFSILAPREFIFNRRTSRNGERISLGYNTTDREWILTEDYCHFRVRKDKEELLDPDFLYLFFLDPEFDRYARFNSWGSATEFFNWEEMIETPVPILPISKQRAIVHKYQVITSKIELLKNTNKALDAIAYTQYKKLLKSGNKAGWHMGTLSELIAVKYGKDHSSLKDGTIPLYGSGGLMRFVERPLYNKVSVLIPRKGSLNNIMYVDEPFWSVDTMYYTEVFNPKAAKFIYYYLKDIDFLGLNTGSAVPSTSSDVVLGLELCIPSDDAIDAFDRLVTPIFSQIKINLQMCGRLERIKVLISSFIGKGV